MHRRVLAVSLIALAVGLALTTSSARAGFVQASQFGSFGSAEGQFIAPGGVAVDSSTGDVYVSDTGNDRVQKFDAAGDFELTFGYGVRDGSEAPQICTSACQTGIGGEGPGQLSSPAGVAVDPSTGDVYVLDTGNDRIQKFTAGGVFISSFGGSGAGRLTGPPRTGGIAVDGAGKVYVADDGPTYPYTPRVAEFDAAGVFQASASSPRVDFKVNDLTVDRAGELYVLSNTPNLVLRFNAAGVAGSELPGILSGGGLATDPTNGHVFVADDNPEGEGLIREFDASGNPVGTTVADPGLEPFSTVLAYSDSVSLPGDEAGAIYVANVSQADVSILGRPIPRAPSVDSQTIAHVGETSAQVKAEVNPGYGDTRVYFEYGTTSSYGSTSPVPPGADIGGSNDDRPASALLSGLIPGTTYHVRAVAVNSAATVRGADRTFTTFSAISGSLPDGRVYELASPADKNHSDIGGGENARTASLSAPEGGAIAFGSTGAFAGAPGASQPSNYVARRSPQGWTTTAITPPQTPTADSGGLYGALTIGVDPQLTASVAFTDAKLTPDAIEGDQNVYLRNAEGDHLIATDPEPNPEANGCAPGSFVPVLDGGSPGLTHAVIATQARLASTPAPPVLPVGTEVQLPYDYSGGVLHYIGVLPDGTVGPDGVAVADSTYCGDSGMPFSNPVSADGTRVFFTDLASHALFVRENDRTTTAISVSQRSGGSTVPQPAVYRFATPDGSRVFFTSTVALTDQVSENIASGGGDLYMYDLEDGRLTDLTVDDSSGDLSGANVQGVAGASSSAAEGTYVYFAATGVLDAQPGPGGSLPVSGAENLYAWHDGRLRFVAEPVSGSADLYGSNRRISNNGRYLAFLSSANLTEQEPAGIAQIYLYDGSSASLSCASCSASDGTLGSGPSFTPGVSIASNNLASVPTHNVTDNGQVFFDSAEALLPSDTNGHGDVYEYEDGRLALISTGRDPAESYFADASADGTDAFFITRQRLVGIDQDNNYDVYDARVGGGIASQNPQAPAPACASEGCRAPASSLPASPLLASVTFVGPGAPATPTQRAASAKATVSLAKTAKGSKFTVRVKIPAAGRIAVSGTSLRSVSKTAKKAGIYKLEVSLSARARKTLIHNGKLKIRVRIAYRPARGSASTTTSSVTLKA